MALALFDLDNTLLAGDSDHAWGDWLCRQGIVDSRVYQRNNDRLYQDYQRGTLNISEYLKFSLAPLKGVDPKQLIRWRHAFMVECIEPIILPKGEALLQKHRDKGDRIVIITSTNRFVTAPIAERLKVQDLIATECEMENGYYTGQPTGVPCFREGKIARLLEWLKTHSETPDSAYFYSDSINDLPLLETVDNPIVVNPDPELLGKAEVNEWPVISLR